MLYIISFLDQMAIKKHSFIFCIFKIFIQCLSYFPFIVITKCWLYSSCCITHPWAYFIPSSLYLLIPYTYTGPLPLLHWKPPICSLFMWVCFFHCYNLCILACCIFKISHITGIIQYLSFFICLISLNIMPKSIHVAASDKFSFFFMVK